MDTSANAAAVMDNAHNVAALPNHFSFMINGGDMMAPASKLDADYYTAHDVNGVTEGAFGSGSLNYLTLQTHQNDALAQTMMTGEAPQETAITNISSSIDTGHSLAHYLQMQGVAVMGPIEQSGLGGNAAPLSAEPVLETNHATASLAAPAPLSAAPDFSMASSHDILSSGHALQNGLNGLDGLNGGDGGSGGTGGLSGSIGDTINNVTTQLGDTVTNITDHLGSTVTGTVSQIGDIVNNAGDALAHILSNPQGLLGGVLDDPTSAVNSLLGQTGLESLPGVGTATNTVTDVLNGTGLGGVTENLTHTVTGALGDTTSLLDSAGLEHTVQSLSGATNSLAHTVGGLLDTNGLMSDAGTVTTLATGTVYGAVEAVTQIVPDVTNTITSGLTDAASTVTDLTSNLIDPTVTATTALTTGTVDGAVDAATQIAPDVTNAVTSSLTDAASTVTDLTSNLMDTAISTAGSAVDALSTAVCDPTGALGGGSVSLGLSATVTVDPTALLSGTADPTATAQVDTYINALNSGGTDGLTVLAGGAAAVTGGTSALWPETNLSTTMIDPTVTATTGLSASAGSVAEGLGILDSLQTDISGAAVHHTALLHL